LLGYTDYDVPTGECLLRAMLARRPEGIVVTGGSHTPAARALLKAAGVPVIESWDLLADPIEHTVGFSNAQAVGTLVRALHAKDYRHIAFLGGLPTSDSRGVERRSGFEQAMRELSLDPGRTLTVGRAPVSMANGAQGMAQLMLRWPDVEAVVCVSDHAAFGALMECHRRGWAVPDRVAIAGFGGFRSVSGLSPADHHGCGGLRGPWACGRRVAVASDRSRGRGWSPRPRNRGDPLPGQDSWKHLSGTSAPLRVRRNAFHERTLRGELPS
jgi:LacI family transcriptional regulator, gluconate utilization system Gnt-I transcriptional repressor